MPRLKHFDNLNTVRFVTISCYRRLKGFNDPRACSLFIKHLESARQKYELKIYAYVIMPEHIHLVMHIRPDLKVGLVIREIKSKMAREYFEVNCVHSGGVFWTKRCYDHNCRSQETIIEKIEYCHKNPVRRGLVKDPSDWKWSSFNYYHNNGHVAMRMDMISS